MPQSTIPDVAHVIQLSVAPVFLLTSIGTILAVLSGRLSRIIDRARVLRERADAGAPAEDSLHAELRVLARRRHLVNLAITSGVCAALFVCVLIATAFVGSMLELNTSTVIALLFVSAMGAFVSALLLFLREILLAVASVRIQ